MGTNGQILFCGPRMIPGRSFSSRMGSEEVSENHETRGLWEGRRSVSEDCPALALDNLTKRFGRFVAVDNLSLQVPRGVMAGFLGPNGAGKSTSLYMIPRLVRPSSGHIRIFGTDIWEDYKKAVRSVGIMVESPAFYE